MSREYSDLQVVPDQSSLEPVPAEKQVATQQGTEKQAGNVYVQQDIDFSNRRICGLRRKPFWIVIAVAAVVIIGAAVGGGVGGALSNSKKPPRVSSSPLSTGSDTSAPTTTVTSSVSITTTTLANPSQTLLRDCPSSNNSVYGVNFGPDRSQLFRKMCNIKLVGNGDNVFNEKTDSLDKCINRCANYNDANQTRIASGSVRVCNAVCWRNSLSSDWPGQCFGFPTQNSSTGGFSIATSSGTECDSAGWINQEIL